MLSCCISWRCSWLKLKRAVTISVILFESSDLNHKLMAASRAQSWAVSRGEDLKRNKMKYCLVIPVRARIL